MVDLTGLERWKRIAYSASCAERIAPLFRNLGSPESVTLFEQGLELLWMAVIREDLIPQAEQLAEKLRNSPEFYEDSAGYRGFFAMDSLHLMAYALLAVVMKDSRPADLVCNAALEIRQAQDDDFTEESKRITSFDPSNRPPPGPLLALEIEHQRETLRLMDSVKEPNAEFINLLKRLSQDAGKEFESAIAELSKDLSKKYGPVQ